MWINFFISMLITALLLYLPTYPFLRALSLSRVSVVCLSPVISVFAYSLLAILYSILGIACTPISMVFPVLCAGAIIYLLNMLLAKSKDNHSQEIDICVFRGQLLLLYVVIGIVLVGIVFIKNLDGPDSLFQAYDNFQHLGITKTFLESGSFSPFGSSNLYAGSNDISPYIENEAFYPAAWHALVALVCEVTNVSVPLGVNAVNATLIGFVFPSGMFYLLTICLKNHRQVLLGAVFCLAVAVCPWDFVMFGPLYPNLLSLAIVPSACACFIQAVEVISENKASGKISWLLLSCAVIAAVGLAHPNGIFISAVFLAPFCVSKTYHLMLERVKATKKQAAIASVACALVILMIWTGFYLLPSFQAVVQFNWESSTPIHQAIIDVLTLGLAGHSAQVIVSIFVLIGLCSLILDSNNRWLAFPFVFAAFSYVVDVSTEGFLKHYLTGFWYTDPHRIATMLGLFAIPLLVRGFGVVLFYVKRAIESGRSISASSLHLVFPLLIFGIAVVIYWPSFEINGFASISTGFGYIEEQISVQNDVNGNHVLTTEELEFSKKALEITGTDALIINSPNDGSAFLYTLLDANVLYRRFALPPIEEEQTWSETIRHGLNKINSNDGVQDSVQSIDAIYLLKLDQGDDLFNEDRQYFWSYWPDQWDGIDAVDDSTPGFEVVLSEKDMRLYKISVYE